MRRLLPDLRPARESPAFRRLVIGSGLSSTGGAMTIYAVTLQVWDLTRSNFAVGALGFTFIPVLVLGLLGGSIADATERRRLALATSGCLAVVSAIFAVQAFAGFGQLWLLYVLAMVQAMVQAIGTPARRTFVARLLPTEQITAGIALNTLAARVAMLIGPALAGVVTGAWGLKACYLIDAVSFIGTLYPTFRLPAMPADVTAGPRRTLRSAAEGLRYIRRTPVILAALLADLDCMLFGLPVALFPGLNAEHFGGRPQTLGLMSAAVGLGGLLSAGLSGPIGRIARQGRGLVVSTAIWGAAFAGFAVAPYLPLALAMLAIAGAVDTFTVVFRGSIVQTVTPDEFRGRVSSVEYIIGVGGGPLGNVEAGTVASLTGSAVLSAFTGGAACAAGAVLLAAAFPALVRYRTQPVMQPPPAGSPAPAPAAEGAAAEAGP